MKNSSFPLEGLGEEALFEEMLAAKSDDVDWRAGKLPGFYVHFANDAVKDVGMWALREFHATNALGPGAFPSVRKFETDLVQWALELFNADVGCGSVTSGGTESIFLAAKTAREWAKENRPEVKRPKMVLSHSAHPAFNKAAKYLEFDVIRVEPRSDFKTDIEALTAELDSDTVLMAGSAPQFTYGVFDQIEELAAIAEDRDIWFHTDACVGGFFSPFAEQLGHDIPPWDFRIPGVRSISADLHKYGFSPKGASVVAFSDPAYHRYQVFDFDDWSRGRYVTSTFAGTRPGANIAAAWAVMRYLGNEGYLEIAARIWELREKLIDGIRSIDGVELCGKPELTLMSYRSDSLDIYQIAAGLSSRGWYTVAPSPNPPAINLGILSLAFGEVMDAYLQDLREVVKQIQQGDHMFEATDLGSYGAA